MTKIQAQIIYKRSYVQEAERYKTAEDDKERENIGWYYSGFRDGLCEVFEGLDMDLPDEIQALV